MKYFCDTLKRVKSNKIMTCSLLVSIKRNMIVKLMQPPLTQTLSIN